MKKYVTIAFLLLGVISNAQISKMPEKVRTSFIQKYTDASNIEWSFIDEGVEIQFDQYDISKVTTYSLGGEWIQTISYITEEEIPDVIINNIIKTDANAYISLVEKIEVPNGSTIFKLIIETDDASFVNEYDMQGKLLSSKKEVYEDYGDFD